MRRYPGKRKAVLSGYAARGEEAFGLSDEEHGQAVAACAVRSEGCEEWGGMEKAKAWGSVDGQEQVAAGCGGRRPRGEGRGKAVRYRQSAGRTRR